MNMTDPFTFLAWTGVFAVISCITILDIFNRNRRRKLMADKFYMIHNTYGNAPAMRHETLESAEKEATRLASKSPGKEFFILESISKFYTELPPVKKELV